MIVFFLLRSFICWNKYLSAKDSRFFANSMPKDDIRVRGGSTAGPQETWNKWTIRPRGLKLSFQNHSTRERLFRDLAPTGSQPPDKPRSTIIEGVSWRSDEKLLLSPKSFTGEIASDVATAEKLAYYKAKFALFTLSCFLGV